MCSIPFYFTLFVTLALQKLQHWLSQIFLLLNTEKLVEKNTHWPYFLMTTDLRWALSAFPKLAHGGPNTQIQANVCFTNSFTGTQPHPFAYILSTAAFTIRQS